MARFGCGLLALFFFAAIGAVPAYYSYTQLGSVPTCSGEVMEPGDRCIYYTDSIFGGTEDSGSQDYDEVMEEQDRDRWLMVYAGSGWAGAMALLFLWILVSPSARRNRAIDAQAKAAAKAAQSQQASHPTQAPTPYPPSGPPQQAPYPGGPTHPGPQGNPENQGYPGHPGHR